MSDSIPLRWGFGGPVIGQATLNSDGSVSGMLISKEHTELITSDLGDYSILDPQTLEPVEKEELMENKEANRTINGEYNRKVALSRSIEVHEHYRMSGLREDQIVKTAGIFETYLSDYNNTFDHAIKSRALDNAIESHKNDHVRGSSIAERIVEAAKKYENFIINGVTEENPDED